MLKKLAMIVVIGAMASSAFASTATARAEAKQVIELKDGSTVYLFKDDTMAMENSMGHPVRMKPDTVMETKDGQKIMMHGDEVMRLDMLFKAGTNSGGNGSAHR